MSFLWYWPAGGWDFDKWKKTHDWTPIRSEQSGQKDPLPLVKPGMTLADWNREAMKWRKVSEQVLGSLSDGAPTNFRHEAIGPAYRTDKFSMQRYRYTLTDEEWGYAWLLVPTKRVADGSAVIALHQTAVSGKDEPVGLQTTPDERAGVYYAQELAERGFVTLAPDAIAFGERQSGHRNSKYKSADQFFTEQPHGSVMAKMGFDAARAVDLLERLPGVNAKRFGCVGHSHGGYGTLFAMLADPRISAGVISCGVSLLRDDPGPERWWRRTALIPRLGFYGDGNGGDMAATPIDFHHWMALVAPRPLMVIAGTQDAIFPNCAALRDRLEMVREVYALHGRKDDLHAQVFDGPHRFGDDVRPKAYDLLERTLTA
jgi:dienelactone hydrolase